MLEAPWSMGMLREPGSGVPFPYHLNSREITSGKQRVGKYCKLPSLTAAPEFWINITSIHLVTSLTVFIGWGMGPHGACNFRGEHPKQLRKNRQIHKKKRRWLEASMVDLQWQSANKNQIQLTVSHWHHQGKVLKYLSFEHANLIQFEHFLRFHKNRYVHPSPNAKKKAASIPMTAKTLGELLPKGVNP